METLIRIAGTAFEPGTPEKKRNALSLHQPVLKLLRVFLCDIWHPFGIEQLRNFNC